VRLDYIGSSILYLLWKRRQQGDGSLISAKRLQRELVGGAAGIKFRDDLRINAVKKTLVSLRKDSLIVGVTIPKDTSDPGPAPTGYRFSADAPIVTHRTTAALIMWLYNHPDQRVSSQRFVQEVVELGLAHHRSQEPLSADDVAEQIAYCIQKGYIEEIYGGPEGGDKRLVVTSKVEEIRMFLERLAGELHRRTERGSELSGISEVEEG